MAWRVTLFGGASYAWPEDAERFTSLDAAAREWERRKRDSYYPCWGDVPANAMDDDGSWYAGFAYREDPRDGDYWSPDAYPDRALRVGPRGGLSWERC